MAYAAEAGINHFLEVAMVIGSWRKAKPGEMFFDGKGVLIPYGRGNNEPTPPRSSSHWSELSEAAGNGDYEAGEKLLQGFATLADDPSNPHPDLVRHLAQCVKRFLEAECSADSARKAFQIDRPRHRPPSKRVEQRHAEALAEYYRSRAAGEGKEAAVAAGAKAGNFTESAMRKVLEEDSILTRFAALFFLPEETKRKALNPPRKRYQRRPK